MANYSNLINSIKAVIKQNGTNDITGQLMQDVLGTMTNTIGRFAAFAGTAMPSTNPNNPDQTVYYLTSIPGTYVNFGGIVVPPDRLVALHNISGSWEMVVVVTFSDGGTISIDPALDPDSPNPVENRIVTGAINGLNSRVTALEQSDVLYNKLIVLRAHSGNAQMVFSILLTTNDGNFITNVNELVSPNSYPILQSKGDISDAVLIRVEAGGAATIWHALSNEPYLSTWDIPAGGIFLVKCDVRPTRQ